MTGQYNVRNYTHFGELPPSERTFGNDLREAGYASAIAGKWQLGKDRKLIDQFGFDEHYLWWLERKSWRYGNVGELIQNGEVLPGEKGEYGPDVLNHFVLDFMERHAAEPFFVYYPMLLPHSPFVPTPNSAGSPDPQDANPAYFKAMVEYTDELVGRVVDKLDALGLRENTLVIFIGDNGTNSDITSNMIDGRSIQGGKGTMTDAGTRVPMIVNWPGTAPAGDSSRKAWWISRISRRRYMLWPDTNRRQIVRWMDSTWGQSSRVSVRRIASGPTVGIAAVKTKPWSRLWIRQWMRLPAPSGSSVITTAAFSIPLQMFWSNVRLIRKLSLGRREKFGRCWVKSWLASKWWAPPPLDDVA